MILQALNQYYETLCARGELSVPGWTDNFKVTFGLDISDDGEILRLIDLREEVQRGKKTVVLPRLMRVPEHPRRSNSIVPNFLCDNACYLLGVDESGCNDKAIARFVACKSLHKEILSTVEAPASQAILSFFRNWEPHEAEFHPVLSLFWDTLLSGVNLIFCYDGQPVSEIESIQDAWQRHYDIPDPFAIKGQCLITGNVGPIAPIHPVIKGVKDAQSSGASLVSFNYPSLCSYGKEQGYNAPISERAAFAYTTALNTLISDRSHCRVVGNTTIVCWAEHGDHAYQDAYMTAVFGDSEKSPNDMLSSILSRVSRGDQIEWEDTVLAENEHFYVLGISPNAARLSVQFFMQDSFGFILRNIQKHYDDLAILAPSYDPFVYLPLWKLLSETVNENSNNKSSSPLLSGGVLRAILYGTPYPAALLNAVEQRIHADRKVTRGRAAIIKAYYTRANIPFPKEVLTVEGNKNSTNIPYTLGRLFSVYEQIQDRAYPNINGGIKDKYFNSASGTPSTIMPLLGNMAQHHLRVIRRTSPGAAVYFEKMLGQYSKLIGETYPVRLSLPEQGAFQLGYYFENQERYVPKNVKDTEE